MLHDIRRTSQRIAKYLKLIEPRVYRSRKPLPVFKYAEIDDSAEDNINFRDLDTSNWAEIPSYSFWGSVNKNFILQTTFHIPLDWDNTLPEALYLPIGKSGEFSHPEALVYIDGEPITAVDHHHEEVSLPVGLSRGIAHSLILHGWTGNMHGGKIPSLLLGECSLVQIDQSLRDFIALARVTLDVVDHFKNNNPIRAQLLTALDQSFNHLDTREPLEENFYMSLPKAKQILEYGIDQSGPPMDVRITAAGHAHIDLAWLWTLNQSRKKTSITFHNAMNLIEQFPDFIYSQSQPQLYEFIKIDFPDLFERIRNKILNGQWEAMGGMWVEADCNIPGGESLIRQLILGREYFKVNFGENSESPVLWLPDVFGFPWSLPQLIKESGIEAFFTIKLGWSQYNRLPYDSFWWQGLDGTRILTHFSTTRRKEDAFVSTYNARATPNEVHTTWENYKQKETFSPGQPPELLMVYGHGNGGGGPTREMIENLLLMGNFPGTPQIHMGKVGVFFTRLRENSGKFLPTWNDELYLEYHRGTYTSQASIKRANRKSEVLLHNLEFVASVAALVDAEFKYPISDIERLWRLVCLNQFHDILAGTSIKEVYDEAQQHYGEIELTSNRLIEQSLELIGKQVPNKLLVINPISFSRCDLLCAQLEKPDQIVIEDVAGEPMNTQTTEDGILLDVGNVAPYSISKFNIRNSNSSQITNPHQQNGLHISENHLENQYLIIKFNSNGDISSIFSKELKQEIISPGEVGNQFQAFEDRPITPDAWEIDIFYQDKVWLAEPVQSFDILERGPLRACFQLKRTIRNSSITQRISLDYNSRQLKFATLVDWREKFTLLKVAFPVQVLSPRATYEIQWGNIQRPTHWNTSWDWAKFESPAHKWVDLSEGGYGVSLLNDCKYGHDIHENVIRLTLLRSPSYPDPTSDRRIHNFTYSLLVHKGDWRSGTIQAAYELNYPYLFYLAPTDGSPGKYPQVLDKSLVRIDSPSLIIETIKWAEDGHGIIVRMYESQRKRGEFTLIPGFNLSKAWRTNILEEEIEELSISENVITDNFSPYQILTYRLIPE